MPKRSRLYLTLYMMLPALISFGLVTTLPSEGQKVLAFGLSKSWLIIALILLGVTLSFLGLTVYAFLHWEKIQNWVIEKLDNTISRNFTVAITTFLLLIATTALGIPDKYLGGFSAINDRIHPLQVWISFSCLQILVGIIFLEIQKHKIPGSDYRTRFTSSIIALVIILGIWMIIAFTGLGLNSANTFWSKIGVPILWPQIGFALVLGIGAHYFCDRFVTTRSKMFWFDILMIGLIWLTAVVFWNNQTYQPGVFNTSPRPPTYEIYPINDSQIFDVGAQKLLLGQRMIADVVDKPIYISFLAILHFLAGYSYAQFYLFQIMIFALIPVCGFLIGKNLYSRSLGAMFATLLVIKEVNAIELTNYIHVSTSKMILSEMLTTLGLLLFLYCFLKWMKSLDLLNVNLFLAGGILGITSLVRLNSIGVLPFAMLLIGFSLKFNWRRWIAACLIFGLFALIGITPWLIRNSVVTGNPVNFISSKTTGVIGNQRYDPIIQSTESTDPQASKQSYLALLGQNISNNYLHNLIGITLMLPPSAELYKALDMIRLPYWKLEWAGALLPDGYWIILTVLVVASLGIGTAWNRWRFAGLAPLVIVLGYNSTTAISLTSGGRYLVPIDWGVLLYFSIGLFEIALAIISLFGWNKIIQKPQETTPAKPTKSNLRQALLIGVLTLTIGAIPVFLEFFPKLSYPPSVTMEDFKNANKSLFDSNNPGADIQLSSIVQIPGAVVIHGEALYPRYFGQNKGDGLSVDQDPLIGSASFDHLSFLVIGGKDTFPVLLPANRTFSPQIPGSDVWVIGCKRQNYLEAVFVVFRQKDSLKTYSEDSLEKTCQ